MTSSALPKKRRASEVALGIKGSPIARIVIWSNSVLGFPVRGLVGVVSRSVKDAREN